MFWISHFASGISLASSFRQSLLWALRQTLPLVFIWPWSAIPKSCWKVVFVCCFRRVLLHIGVGLMGWCPENYICVGICGRVMHRDLRSYYYSRKGGAWMWLCPLCWQQQSKLHALPLTTCCFHGKWDGRWRNQKIGRRRHWCLLQTLCPLGAHSSSGGIWGHSWGGMPFFLQWPGSTFERQRWCGRGVSVQKSLFFCSYV